MSNPKLTAETRTEFGKGAARRLRATGQIPAVLYGHGTDPVHLALPGHETTLATRISNALLEINVGGKTELALVKDMQLHPVKRDVKHLDLLLVRKGEKVEVEITVHVAGEPAAPAAASIEHHTITVSVPATHIPEWVEVSVEGLEDGSSVSAGEIILPGDAELVTDPETVVITVAEPRIAEEPEEAGEAEAEEAEPAEEAAEGEEK